MQSKANDDDDYADYDDYDNEEEDGNTDWNEDYYEFYRNQIAASSDEETEYGLNPDINYNEITDEEPTDEEVEDNKVKSEVKATKKENEAKRSIEEDDFFTSSEPSLKKNKSSMKDIQLPRLATGYYSGGESDDDAKNDELVDEITKPRKNRRGQRARQKIWEKKYGSGAKHVAKQQERAKSDRERLKLEFEARQVKRDLKQKEREEREKIKTEKIQKQQEKSVHPSWEAKLKAQESMKNAKPAGKKITFD
ncbi:hypothetical protein C6P40_002465 [Pichia californica]|uniref:Bud22 domain-containing protein n=1 Tax=Pichia californica TaxID=460514 RepID=A0A9P6WHQ5_9ASCO|nr:hypothetical protein C6P40_002465 [[Candida] californica]